MAKPSVVGTVFVLAQMDRWAREWSIAGGEIKGRKIVTTQLDFPQSTE